MFYILVIQSVNGVNLINRNHNNVRHQIILPVNCDCVVSDELMVPNCSNNRRNSIKHMDVLYGYTVVCLLQSRLNIGSTIV
ncbi:hypothetical protein BLOT_016277 [Blomia tropicalis]|nr:hypothetical protein BLOT_016277 [Blomia tropicalis]